LAIKAIKQKSSAKSIPFSGTNIKIADKEDSHGSTYN
jgi:hypothetical protein